MKHLKKFESFTKEDYYFPIDESEYNYDNLVDFDKDILNRLKNAYKLNTHMEVLFVVDGVKYGIYVSGSYPKNILITQHKDEWFYIRGEVDDIMSGPYNPAYIYYKCDQLEGLIEYLSDYGFIKKI